MIRKKSAFIMLLLKSTIVLIITVACSANLDDEMIVEDLVGSLKIAANNGLYISEKEVGGNKVIYHLSDGRKFQLYYSDCSIISIGVDGNWYKNGIKTNSNVQDSARADLFDGSSQYYKAETIIGAIEGYDLWSFIVSNGASIVLQKEVLPDDLLRGINHRGYNYEAPENTLEAFRLSRLKGFVFVETDVRFTVDNVPVLLHDVTVDRTSNGTGRISSMTYSQVKNLDFGSWKSPSYKGVKIPSFEEFIELCSSIGLLPYIELKDGSMSQVKELVSIVSKYGLNDKATYISFSPKLLGYVEEIDPYARLGYLCGEVDESVISNCYFLQNGSNSVFVDSCFSTQETISLCSQSRLPLEVWTIDSEQEICSLPRYVSGVTSNHLHAGKVIKEAEK